MEKKLCRVRVLGVMEQDGEKEEIETLSDGFLDLSGNLTKIWYKEISEEGEETKVSVTFRESKTAGGLECRIVKKGLVQSDMLFIPGEQTFCIYQTPFGELELETETTCVELNLTEKRADGHLTYFLSSGGKVISNAEVFIEAICD